MKTLSLVLLIGLVVVARAQTQPEIAGRAALFRYDNTSPVVFKEVSSEKRGDVVVRDITFSVGRRAPDIKAYLVAPAARDRSPPSFGYTGLALRNQTERSFWMKRSVLLKRAWFHFWLTRCGQRLAGSEGGLSKWTTRIPSARSLS